MLDDQHKTVLYKAVRNLLSLPVAENTFAQILDGLPTVDGLSTGFEWVAKKDHPVLELQHKKVCDGLVAKVRLLRENLDLSRLSFDQWAVDDFKQTLQGLEKLVAVACHNIAAELYEQDDGTHKHQIHHDWYEKALATWSIAPRAKKGVRPRPVAFSHFQYFKPERFPRGDADVAGYWTEGKIFGGVVLFDRGESERECNSVWLHGEKSMPYTLYPPTEEQFSSLITFLLSDPDSTDKDHLHALQDACPLPIYATDENVPRWDPWEAATKFHIFREKNALEIPAVRYLGCTSIRQVDWPEMMYSRRVYELQKRKSNGESYDEEKLAIAQTRAKLMTPTSPWTHPKPDWYQNSIWTGVGSAGIRSSRATG